MPLKESAKEQPLLQVYQTTSYLKYGYHPLKHPPVLNDAELCGKIRDYSSGILGKENIVKVDPAMVGEDFGMYGCTPEKVPICLIWLGSTNPEVMNDYLAKGEEPPPLHSPFLNPDYPATIGTGIKAMVMNVIGLFEMK